MASKPTKKGISWLLSFYTANHLLLSPVFACARTGKPDHAMAVASKNIT